MLHTRHWSLEEVNAALPYVGRQVDRLQCLLAKLTSQQADEAFAVVRTAPGGGWPGRELAAAAVRLALGLNELQEADIVVRDLERGLIDFPSVRDGEEIYLCWLRTEPEVRHWHTPDSGFAGRRPV